MAAVEIAPCSTCELESSCNADFFSNFEFEQSTLEYNDAPLSGFLICKVCQRRYAFVCEAVIPGLLFHWKIVIAPPGDDPRAALVAVALVEEGAWLSVTEDHRTGQEQIVAVRIANVKARPVALTSRQWAGSRRT
jgi:hypothetical protein